MYIPLQYQNKDLEEIKGFIQENAFAILINQVDGQSWATHLPLELASDDNDSYKLVGHLAKANPQWKSFRTDSEVLVIFNGPHSYISSSLYKKEEVPTWNYIAVHIYGTISILSESELYKSLVALVDRYERDSKHPVSVPEFSKKTMRQIKGVVGFEISVNKIQAAYKLSQGRPEDHHAIEDHLKDSPNAGSQDIAREMKKRRLR
ncbi:MAG: FMN-binding negative transcriptional regulator [Flavobacteriaceae bacterium]